MRVSPSKHTTIPAAPKAHAHRGSIYYHSASNFHGCWLINFCAVTRSFRIEHRPRAIPARFNQVSVRGGVGAPDSRTTFQAPGARGRSLRRGPRPRRPLRPDVAPRTTGPTRPRVGRKRTRSEAVPVHEILCPIELFTYQGFIRGNSWCAVHVCMVNWGPVGDSVSVQVHKISWIGLN